MPTTVPYIKVPDTEALRPGVRDFTFSFKFKLVMNPTIIQSLLPGHYGPFVGFHKQLYYINKVDDGTLRLVCSSGFMPQGLTRLYRRGETSPTAFTGIAQPFVVTISPNTTYTVTFTKTTTPRTTNTASLTLAVSPGSTSSQTLTGRTHALFPSTSGYAVFAGVYETYHLFPGDIGPISLIVDDISLSIQQQELLGLKYRMRIDSYLDNKSYAVEPDIIPTVAPPAPTPSPTPTPTPTPTPGPAPTVPGPGLTLFATTNTGLKWSQDAGVTFNDMTSVTNANWYRLVKSASGRLVLTGGGNIAKPNLATSTDFGATWFETNDSIVLSQGGSFRAFYIGATAGPNVVACNFSSSGGATALLTSIDNGFSWGRSTTGTYSNCVFYDSALSLYIAASFNAFWSSPDGLTWTFRGTVSGSWSNIAKGASTLVAVNSAGSTWAKSTTGTSWTTFAAPASATTIAGNNVSTFIAGGNAAALYISTNDGSSWSTISSLPVTFTLVRWVVWTGSEFIALVYDSGAIAYRLMASPTGTTWAARGSDLASPQGSLTYNALESITL